MYTAEDIMMTQSQGVIEFWSLWSSTCQG